MHAATMNSDLSVRLEDLVGMRTIQDVQEVRIQGLHSLVSTRRMGDLEVAHAGGFTIGNVSGRTLRDQRGHARRRGMGSGAFSAFMFRNDGNAWDDEDAWDDEGSWADREGLFARIDNESYIFFGRPGIASLGIVRAGSAGGPFELIFQALRDREPGPSIVCNLFLRPSEAGHPSDRVLCAVDESRDLIVLEVGTERYGRPVVNQSRITMPISSNMNILPRVSAQIVSRPPQGYPFRPDRLIIGQPAEDWVINDIRIGQLTQVSGDLPGELFSSTMIEGFIRFPVVQATMDLALTVRYVGGDPAGRPFNGAFIGQSPEASVQMVADHRSVLHWMPEGRYASWLSGTSDALAGSHAL